MTAKNKKPQLILPTLSSDNLPDDIEKVSTYIAKKFGVPQGTVVLAMTGILMSLRSRRVEIDWAGQCFRPRIALLLTEGHRVLAQDWMDFLLVGLRSQVTKPESSVGPSVKSAIAGFDAAQRLLNSYLAIPSNQRSPAIEDRYQQSMQINWDAGIAERFSEGIPQKEGVHVGYDFCPLVVGKSDGLTQQANNSYLGKDWEHLLLGFDTPAGRAAPYTSLLRANSKALVNFAGTPIAQHFFPVILPEGGGTLGDYGRDDDAVVAAWERLVSDASHSWHNPSRTLTISDHGYEAVSTIKSQLESNSAHNRFQVRFSWAPTACLSLAAWHHLTYGKGDEIGVPSWDFALELTRWAILAHTACLRIYFRVGVYAPDVGPDMERLRNRVRQNPEITHRDLVRALPKRAKGYWRKLHKVLEDSPQSLHAKISANKEFQGFAYPKRPTHPTSDKSGSGKPSTEP